MARTEVIAHRGASAYAPENTMPSFDLVISHDAGCVEHDLHVTKDRVLVCLHDRSAPTDQECARGVPASRTGRARRRRDRAAHWLVGVAGREPRLFAHWYSLGLRPGGRMLGAVSAETFT